MVEEGHFARVSGQKPYAPGNTLPSGRRRTLPMSPFTLPVAVVLAPLPTAAGAVQMWRRKPQCCPNTTAGTSTVGHQRSSALVVERCCGIAEAEGHAVPFKKAKGSTEHCLMMVGLCHGDLVVPAG